MDNAKKITIANVGKNGYIEKFFYFLDRECTKFIGVLKISYTAFTIWEKSQNNLNPCAKPEQEGRAQKVFMTSIRSAKNLLGY